MSEWISKGILVIALMLFMHTAFAEEVTVTTYYPSPEGKYKKLQTTDETLLATDTASETARVGIGTTTPDAKAILDLSSTTQVFLPPRMTAEQRDLLGSPPAGSLIYNTTNNAVEIFNGTAWAVSGGSSGGGCYVSYSGGCAAGFTNKGSAGTYGNCLCSAWVFRPAGSGCISGCTSYDIGTAYVCCQ